VRGGDSAANNLWLACSLVDTLAMHAAWLRTRALLLPAAVYSVLRLLPDAKEALRKGGAATPAAQTLLAKGGAFAAAWLRDCPAECQVRLFVRREGGSTNMPVLWAAEASGGLKQAWRWAHL